MAAKKPLNETEFRFELNSLEDSLANNFANFYALAQKSSMSHLQDTSDLTAPSAELWKSSLRDEPLAATPHQADLIAYMSQTTKNEITISATDSPDLNDSSTAIFGVEEDLKLGDIFKNLLNSTPVKNLTNAFDAFMTNMKGTVVTDYLSGKANGEAGFDIAIHFSGTGWTPVLQKAFINAADYFTTIITKDIGGDRFIDGKRVDDLYVTAELTSIDGQGGTLARAGVDRIWGNELTATGHMLFDTADVSKYAKLGVWDDIVTHELMHVLGFGGMWNHGTNPLVTAEGQYTGKFALAAYNAVTGKNNAFIPVETDGGTGTANKHWDETALDKEMMTGYTDNSGNYMSKYTIMSLADLGYTVAYKDYQYDNAVIA